MPKNYWRLRDKSIFYIKFAYLDAKDYLADALFAQYGIKVRYGPELEKPGELYVVISCKVRKKDERSFLAALAELENKMLLLGHADYPDYCRRMMDSMDEVKAEPDE